MTADNAALFPVRLQEARRLSKGREPGLDGELAERGAEGAPAGDEHDSVRLVGHHQAVAHREAHRRPSQLRILRAGRHGAAGAENHSNRKPLSAFSVAQFNSAASFQDIMNREKESQLPEMQVKFIDSICLPIYEV